MEYGGSFEKDWKQDRSDWDELPGSPCFKGICQIFETKPIVFSTELKTFKTTYIFTKAAPDLCLVNWKKFFLS